MVFPYFPFHDGRNVPATAISDGSGGELQRRPYQEGNMAFPAVSAVDKCLCPSYSLWRDTDSRQRNGGRLFCAYPSFDARRQVLVPFCLYRRVFRSVKHDYCRNSRIKHNGDEQYYYACVYKLS